MFKKILIVLAVLVILLFTWEDLTSFLINMFGGINDISIDRDYSIVQEQQTLFVGEDKDETRVSETSSEPLVAEIIVVDGEKYQVVNYINENLRENYYCIDDSKLYDNYMKILFASLVNVKKEIKIDGLTVDMIEKYTDDIFDILVETEYMMFFDGFEWTQSGNRVVNIKLLYNDEVLDCYEQSKQISEQISKEIFKPEMDDVQKAKAAYDYVILNTEYSEQAAAYVNSEDVPRNFATAYESYGVFLEHSAVCQGYAYAFNMLLSSQGIENRYVQSNSLNHGWSMIEVDGDWYHCDISYDDPIPDRKGVSNHEFFLKNDAFMADFEPARLENTTINSNANNYHYEIYDYEFYILNDVPYVYLLEGDAVVRYHSDDDGIIDFSSGKTVVGDVLSWHNIEGEFSFLYTQKSDGDLYKIYFDGRNAVRLIKGLGGYIVDVQSESGELVVSLVESINGNKSIVTIN